MVFWSPKSNRLSGFFFSFAHGEYQMGNYSFIIVNHFLRINISAYQKQQCLNSLYWGLWYRILPTPFPWIRALFCNPGLSVPLRLIGSGAASQVKLQSYLCIWKSGCLDILIERGCFLNSLRFYALEGFFLWSSYNVKKLCPVLWFSF